MPQKRAWKGTTGGGKFGQRSLFFFFRYVDVRVGYFFMIFTLPFYMLFRPADFRAIYRYFRLRHEYSATKSFLKTFSNYAIFGQVVLDRFALLAGADIRFKVDIYGREHFDNLTNSQSGFMIAGSHTGNFEIAGYLFKQDKKSINSIYFGGESVQLQQKRMNLLSTNNINLIPVLPDMSHLFKIKQALDNGEIVSMPCDRLFGSAKHITCKFLGKDANFPLGAFITAAQLNVKMVALFVMKDSMHHYSVYVKPIKIVETTTNSNRTKAEMLAKQYVTELEHIINKYPEQWFNYFDFWEQNFDC